jgi:hypothetical protein
MGREQSHIDERRVSRSFVIQSVIGSSVLFAVFWSATSFNQPLKTWKVVKVENIDRMFKRAFQFNQPLNGWNVSKVENMSHIFDDAKAFNQPLDRWDVHNVRNMAAICFDLQYHSINPSKAGMFRKSVICK